MEHLETNIYLIKNLEELNCKYQLYSIKGVPYTNDYYENIQALTDKASNITKSPCTPFNKDKEVLIAQPVDFPEIPEKLEINHIPAKIKKLPEVHKLKFDSLTPATSKLARRFLQFSLQDPLKINPSLWQPRSGYPFYSKVPAKEFCKYSDSVNVYKGFTFRVVSLSKNRIGLCIDPRRKYVAHDPLPNDINREEFKKKYKGNHCVYEYGDTWYEIKVEALNDLTVSEVELPGGETLYENIHKKTNEWETDNIRSLSKDCSVLVYYNRKGEQRNVPSGLCRLIYSTDHPEVKQFHSEAILNPWERREGIQYVVSKYLRSLTFGSIPIKFSEKPLVLDKKKLKVPDLRFGNNTVLSVRETSDSNGIPLQELPKEKKTLLYSDEAGIVTETHFDRQYFILPRSMKESWGDKFITDLEEEVHRICPEEMDYSPRVVSYEDSDQRGVYSLGNEILRTVNEQNLRSGYGIVMIPRVSPMSETEEDELANLVMSELRKRDLYVSVIHTEVAKNSYERSPSETKAHEWRLVLDRDQRKKFKGYLRVIAINKVLLTNNKWPFILNTPLNSDLTIGIDVKNNTAGFTFIYETGKDLRFISSPSNQKEKLSEDHMLKRLYETIKEEQKLFPKKNDKRRNLQKIAIHRQGTLFHSEKKGIKNALEKLSNEGIISKNYEVNLLEIKTTSRIPFRLFKVKLRSKSQKERTYNPTIGTYFPLTQEEVFLCNTGYPYTHHHGTTNPVRISKIEGEMSLEKLLEDIFALSNLTWTKIDDCSRLPLSIKMNDIRLREIAGKYDEDSLRFSIENGEE